MDAAVDQVKESQTRKLLAVLWTVLSEHFILILVGALVANYTRRRYVSPLRDLPGPFLASCSRLWKGAYRMRCCSCSTQADERSMEYIQWAHRGGPYQVTREIWLVGLPFART